MGLKYKPFETLIPEWEDGEKKKDQSERDTLPPEKGQNLERQPSALSVSSCELLPNSEGLVERHIGKTLLGRVDASTSIGGPRSKYEVNEDGFVIHANERELGVIVCDGAGGSGEGALATKIASETFQESMHEGDDLMDAFDAISENVLRDGNGGYLAACALHALKRPDGVIRVNVANSGDTKILTIRDGKRLDAGTTTLQNFGQSSVKAGLIEPWKYYTYKLQNQLTGSLGAGKTPEPPEFRAFDHQKGDQSLLAGDGLWDLMSEYEILQLAQKYRGRELQEKIFQTVFDRSNAGTFDIQHSPDHTVRKTQNKGDNITVVLIG